MKGQDKFLTQFIDGSSFRFIIPVYQRNYDWKKENCAQLYNDLVKTIRQDKASHFFGSIVYASANNGHRTDFLIIDGQQRLTTVTLLLAAVSNLLNEGVIESNDKNLSRRIEETYLIDKYTPDERKIRLKPIKNDCMAFDNIIMGKKDCYDHKSNVTSNYLYFYERIKNQEISADQIFTAVDRLKIIDIFLDKEDEPQAIFESLNSTGLDLEEGDKIRNYVLMGHDSKTQEEYYENYWNPIEKLTDYKVSSFVRDYLAVKQGRIPVIEFVYITFKEFVENPKEPLPIQEVLEEMLCYAKIFNEFSKATTYSSPITAVLKRLMHLDMSIVNPFFMAFFKYAQDNQESDEAYIRVLSCIETFIFRRLICSYGTNALNKLFCTLHKDVIKLKGEHDNYADVMIYILINKKGSSSFPEDNDFEKNLLTRNIYSMNSKNKMYLFSRLENGDSKERVDVVKTMSEGILTIEHIMPQALTEQWKVDLGYNYSIIYEEWLNTLPNLTLTGYNSKYKNRPFIEKRDITDGFRHSNLRLNKFMSECIKWTEDELIERKSLLWTRASTLWHFPLTSFEPLVEGPEVHSLDEDFLFRGHGIISFSFQGTQYKAISWVGMFIDVVKLLHEIDPALMYQMIEANAIELTAKKQNWNTEIAEGLYLYTANDTMTKIRILRKLISKYGIDESELEFSLPVQIDSEESEL